MKTLGIEFSFSNIVLFITCQKCGGQSSHHIAILTICNSKNGCIVSALMYTDVLLPNSLEYSHMWQCWVETEHYSVAYFHWHLKRGSAELPLRVGLVRAV